MVGSQEKAGRTVGLDLRFESNLAAQPRRSFGRAQAFVLFQVTRGRSLRKSVIRSRIHPFTRSPVHPVTPSPRHAFAPVTAWAWFSAATRPVPPITLPISVGGTRPPRPPPHDRSHRA